MKKLKDILKESNVQIGKVYSNPYAKSFVKEEEEERPQAEELTTEQKHAFLEAVKQFKKYGEAVYRNAGLGEVYESIKNMVEMAGKVTISETDDWFDNVTVSRHMKRMGESFKVFEKTLKEVSTLQQRLEASYDEIGEVLGKYYEINEMEDEIEEGNEFGAARAKAIANGDDSFEVDGKKYPVKDVDADDKENAKEFSNESMKLSDMIKKPSVNEAALPKDGSIIKVSNIPVKIEYVSSKKYIGYSWKDKNNKEHYEETKVSEHSDLNSLIKTIASEIRYQQIHKNESMKLTDMISVNEAKNLKKAKQALIDFNSGKLGEDEMVKTVIKSLGFKFDDYSEEEAGVVLSSLIKKGKIPTDNYVLNNVIDVLEESAVTEAEIKSADEFKEYAFKVLQKAFGEDFDEAKAQEVVDGILDKCGDDYGACVGMLQSSLG